MSRLEPVKIGARHERWKAHTALASEKALSMRPFSGSLGQRLARGMVPFHTLSGRKGWSYAC